MALERIIWCTTHRSQAGEQQRRCLRVTVEAGGSAVVLAFGGMGACRLIPATVGVAEPDLRVGPWRCLVCDGAVVGGPELGWRHQPADWRLDAEHDPQPWSVAKPEEATVTPWEQVPCDCSYYEDACPHDSRVVPSGPCPDGGACHHDCALDCWRVGNAGPLSGVYPNDEWPQAVVEQHRQAGKVTP